MNKNESLHQFDIVRKNFYREVMKNFNKKFIFQLSKKVNELKKTTLF